MVLTKDQQVAKDTIISFINKPITCGDDCFITLAGFAGTGKTTVMGEILNEVSSSKKVAVSAPTHKAKKVIADATNKNAETIQGLLGLRPNVDMEDFDPNKPAFKELAECRLSNYKLVVIDESSMLNKAAVKLIKEKAIRFKVKVIFMGDKFQLPPIGEIISDVFKLTNKVELNEIVRQKSSNPNQMLIELARNDVRDKTDKCLVYLKQILVDMNLEEGFMYLERDKFYPAILEKFFDSAYVYDPTFIKLIAYRKKTCNDLNLYVRQKLLSPDAAIVIGDKLMGQKAVSISLKVAPYYKTIVENSADYTVLDVQLIETDIENIQLKFYRCKVTTGERNPIVITSDLFKEVKTPGEDVSEMDILHPLSYDDFIKAYTKKLDLALTRKMWKQFYAFKEKVVILDDFYDTNGKIIVDRDISYGYAITVHKSQGSTYKHVGIPIADILVNYNAQERRKLLYVALSRASTSNILF